MCDTLDSKGTNMRLTTTLKDAFINSVMADVPSVDYTEQKIKLIQAAAHNVQPPLLKKFIKEVIASSSIFSN